MEYLSDYDANKLLKRIKRETQARNAKGNKHRALKSERPFSRYTAKA